MTFYYHFNKPATQREGRVRVSVHVAGQCHIVDNVDCRVPCKGSVRQTQPKFVMRGRCTSFEIVDGVGVLS
jgi:hypothetical protein